MTGKILIAYWDADNRAHVTDCIVDATKDGTNAEWYEKWSELIRSGKAKRIPACDKNELLKIILDDTPVTALTKMVKKLEKIR